MSPSWERIATSASNPEAIARAWAPDPLYDSSNVELAPGLGSSTLPRTPAAHRRASTSRTTE